jgi:DNA-binding GntR family transcriptional regulator
MTPFELAALMAATLVGSGRTPTGAVAEVRALLDELKRAEPEMAAAHCRAQITEARRRAETSKADR